MENKDTRVVVTGVNLVTPIGLDRNEFWENALKGISGIKEITLFSTEDCYSKIGAIIPDFKYKLNDRLTLPFSSKYTRIYKSMFLCLDGLIEDAGLKLNKRGTNPVGLFLGHHSNPDIYNIWRHMTKTQVFKLREYLEIWEINDLAYKLASRYRINGPAASFFGGCGSGAYALADAFFKIKNNEISQAIAGAGSLLSDVYFSLLDRLDAISNKGCFPYDQRSDGIVLGEAVGFLLLESLEAAEKRGAHIYCEVLGCGLWGESESLQVPLPTGGPLAKAIEHALNESRVEAGDIDHINLMGVSDPKTDLDETLAIKKVFKEKAYQVSTSTITPYTAHPLGAAAFIHACAAILMLDRGTILPTLNLEEPLPGCDLDYTPHAPVKKDINTLMNIGYGYGGNNCVIIFRKQL
ncbi:MAG: hypothetical protein JSV88_27955 [Candidatus Aminicenantes bacterium]|nr:MAG: hypothetical protein JSV88_27955 [Candidatus Aminicenantes bacterium]